MRNYLIMLGISALLFGCMGLGTSPEPVVDSAATMEFLEPGLRPEELLFPEYLMMEGFELNRHGRIPETERVGAGLRSKMSLSKVRICFMDALDVHQWENIKLELDNLSFRLMADHGEEQVEIRGVQGTISIEVFILYQPASTALSTSH